MRLRAVFVFAGAITIPACSLFVGWDGLSDGTAPLSSDGEPATDNAAEDAATVDGVAPPPPNAGGIEGAIDGSPDGAASVCDVPHTFCDDFTSETFPNLTQWTTLIKAGSSIGVRTTESSVSGPAAFRAESVGSNSVNLVKGLPGPIQTLTCEFSIKASPKTGSKVVFRNVIVDFEPAASSPLDWYEVAFQPAKGDGSLVEQWTNKGGGYDERHGGIPISLDQWVRVRLTLTAGPSPSVALSYNGDPAGTLALANFPKDHASLSVNVGVMTESGASGGSALFDDVFCDVTQ